MTRKRTVISSMSKDTEVSTKDETSKTTFRNLFKFRAGQNCLRYFLNPIVNHLSTRLKAENQYQALDRHVLRIMGSSLQSHSV